MIQKKYYFISVISLTLMVLSYLYLDRQVAVWCHAHLSEQDHLFFRNITQFGESTYYLIGFTFAFVNFKFMLKRPRWAARFLFLFTSVAVSGIAVNIIKVIAGRFRPSEFFINGDYGFTFFQLSRAMTSFPSGHTVTAFALATAISHLWPRLSIPAWIFAISIGISRIAIGAHYPSDVLGGAFIGTLSVYLILYYWKKKTVLAL
jgi:membrane-associated phospholipid phosphatase